MRRNLLSCSALITTLLLAAPSLAQDVDADAEPSAAKVKAAPRGGGNLLGHRGIVRTLAATIGRGAAFFVDYGFPEAEYYHPQRRGGTLMCHRAHRADADPLADVGDKDITAHVDFTAIALAAQDAGMDVLGYTSQARFLINCGLPGLLAEADLPARTAARRLIDEHEMGELFKVVALAKGVVFDAVGFAQGDRSHRL